MKYPRTYHLPWSPGKTSDDKVLSCIDSFLGVPLIITEKLDGGNACLTNRCVYARSHSKQAKHASFSWLKAKHAEISSLIPEDYFVFGENLYAKHSISYSKLKSYFYIFAVYDKKIKKWLSFKNVKLISNIMNFPYVPLLWEGCVSDDKLLKKIILEILDKESSVGGNSMEGIVVRNQSSFAVDEFKFNVAKWVRKNHIQTDRKWKANWTKNKLI